MRHPIDKIFNKGLGHQKHEFSQSEWISAKAMLDLDKRKKRIPIWWLGAAAGILLGVVILYTFQNKEKTSEALAIETSSAKQDPKTQSAAISNLSDSSVDGSNEGHEGQKTPFTSEITPNNVNYEVNSSSNNGSKAARKVDDKTSSNIITSAPSKVDRTNPIPNVSGSEEKSITSEKLTPRYLSEDHDLSTRENKSSINLSLDEDNEREALATTSRSLLNIGFLRPEIHSFQTKLSLPELNPIPYESQKITNDRQQLSQWSMNLYAAFSIPNAKPSLGINLNRKINERWAASIGIGMAYHKTKSSIKTAEINIISSNGRSQITNVRENLTFRQLTLEVPANLNYRIGRHSVLATAMVDINLRSELTQDALISPSSNMDVLEPVTVQNDPVTLSQQSSTFNNPVLSRPKYFVGLGYGYAISRNLTVQTQGMWNLTQTQGELQSDFLNNQLVNFTEPKWHLRTSIFLKF